jgi:hypothetical protein
MKVIGTTCLTLLLVALSGCAISASPDDQELGGDESAAEGAGDLGQGRVGTTGQAYGTDPGNLPTFANAMRSGDPSQPSPTNVNAVSGGESHEPHPNPWRLNSDPSGAEQPSNPDRRSQSL